MSFEKGDRHVVHAGSHDDEKPMQNESKVSIQPAAEHDSNILETTTCSFYTIGDSLMQFLEKVFYNLGTFIAKRPFITILLSLIFVAILASGIRVLKEENRNDKLWVPTDSRAQDDKKV